MNVFSLTENQAVVFARYLFMPGQSIHNFKVSSQVGAHNMLFWFTVIHSMRYLFSRSLILAQLEPLLIRKLFK